MVEAVENRPDVFLIVLDCVSARALTELLRDPGKLPAMRSFLAGSLWFENAVTTAPYSQVTHASLLTGLYPWHHQVYYRGAPDLPANIPTLAEILRANDYQTFLISANSLVKPPWIGITRGFQTVMLGAGSDTYLRALSPPCPGMTISPGGVVTASPQPMVKFRSATKRVMRRFPLIVDFPTRMAGRFRSSHPEGRFLASPWVESKLRSQLESLSGESPVFGLIGLMDAHEPYIGTELGRLSPIEYLRLLTTRQDRDGWFQGRWKPSPSELANLEWLYLRTIETLDRRVGRILEALRASRPGENSVIVVMSDHGQMFSAQDTIFHAGLLEEEVVRVPLAIQFPHARHSGKRSTQWVSTVDVMPTILSEAGIPAKWTTDGLVLGAAQEEVRSTPVWTLSDGYTIGTGKRIPQERLDWLDRFGLLAISVEGRLQLPFDVDDASSVGRLGTEESTKSVPPDLGGLRQQMLEIQTLICRQVAGRGRGQPDPMAVGDARVRPQYDSSPNG